MLQETLAKLDNLRTWPPGWNGYDAPAANPAAVDRAKAWIEKFYLEVTESGQQWLDPLAHPCGHDAVVFEWWHKERKLTIYVDEDVEYLQVHGRDANSEITDGTIESADDGRMLWEWLMS